jgi:putative MATE family efflux protein
MPDPEKTVRDKSDLVSGSLARNIARLALPVAAGVVMHALYGMVDVFWLGKLGEGDEAARAIAAPGVSFPFVWLSVSFAMGFGTAGTAVVAQYMGAGKRHKADTAAAQMFTILMAIVCTLGLPLLIFAPRLFALFQVPEDAIAICSTYARIILSGLPVMVIAIGYGAVMRALGDSLTPVLIQAGGNVLNTILDPVFIFGLGPVPMMRSSGAATATLISQVAAAAVCIYLLLRGRNGLRIAPRDLRPDWPVIRRMAAVGLPTAIGNSSMALGYGMFQIILNSLGTVVISATTVGFRVIHLLMSPGEALTTAVTPVVGQALGAGKPEVAHRAVSGSSKVLAVVLLPATIFLTWQHGFVARLLVKNPEVAAETSKLLLWMPLSMYLFYVTLVLLAAFYGSGHTKPAMVVHVLRLWGLRFPLAFLLAKVLLLGSSGAYAAMVIGNVVSAVISIWLFRRGKWKSAVVVTRDAA